MIQTVPKTSCSGRLQPQVTMRPDQWAEIFMAPLDVMLVIMARVCSRHRLSKQQHQGMLKHRTAEREGPDGYVKPKLVPTHSVLNFTPATSAFMVRQTC